MLSLAVDVNGIVIPGGLVQDHLARYAECVVVNNGDPEYRISLAGSGALVRFRGREILLTTQHQLKDIDERQIGLLVDGGNVVTSGGFQRYRPHPETDAYDMVAFDFSEPAREVPGLANRFFTLADAPPKVPNTHVLAMLLAGFVFKEQDYAIHEENRLGLARRHVLCLPDSQPADEVLLRIRAVQTL